MRSITGLYGRLSLNFRALSRKPANCYGLLNMAKTKSQTNPRVLYGENDPAVLESQATHFENAGFRVERVVGRKAIEQALKQGGFEVFVLGHTLTRDDRHHLPYMAKKADREISVLVLHASGKHPEVDAAIDSRQGPKAVIEWISDLIRQKSVNALAEYQTTTKSAIATKL